MKNFLSDPRPIFTYLAAASVVAMGLGVYLGLTLGMAQVPPAAMFSMVGMLLWLAAWAEFMGLCLRLRKGESAFTQETGYTLRAIGLCMVFLAVVTLACMVFHPSAPTALLGIPVVGVFLAVALIAKILRGLLEHAMALEKEQEGVV